MSARPPSHGPVSRLHTSDTRSVTVTRLSAPSDLGPAAVRGVRVPVGDRPVRRSPAVGGGARRAARACPSPGPGAVPPGSLLTMHSRTIPPRAAGSPRSHCRPCQATPSWRRSACAPGGSSRCWPVTGTAPSRPSARGWPFLPGCLTQRPPRSGPCGRCFSPRPATAAAAINQARRLGVGAFRLNRGLLGYAEAIVAGRAGDQARARRLAAEADTGFVNCAMWGHLARALAAEPAHADGWGQPRHWLAESRDAFTRHDLHQLARVER